MTSRVAASLFLKTILPTVTAGAAVASVTAAVLPSLPYGDRFTEESRSLGRSLLPHRVECERRPTPPTSSVGRNFVADAVEKVLPSVVRVEVHVKPSSGPTGMSYNQRGSGSGFLIHAKDILPTSDNKISQERQAMRYQYPPTSDDVLVITNAHCVLTPSEFQQNTHDKDSKVVYLELSDERTVTDSIIAFDTDRDVALIQLHGLEGRI
jgi:S1-C subfamily serine protease